VTPVFNGARYIASCIDNVASQGLADVEHIVVDGGSSDGTLDLVRDLARRHPHIRLVEGPDRGQSDALNKGIRAASAEIIGILNCDDFYEPGVLARVGALFQGQPTPSLVVGNCLVHNEVEGNRWINSPRDLRPQSLLLGVDYVEFPCNPSAYFYHKAAHDLVGPYDVDEHFAMDLEFILRAVQRCHTIYVDELWGNFRYHDTAKTFRDKAAGAQRARLERIYERYRAELPALIRMQMRLRQVHIDAKRRYWRMCRALAGGAAPSAN
jgi:glycosyltransferase involved in cell wall biosynthesis